MEEPKDMKTSELMDEMNKAEDDRWDDLWEEAKDRSPFTDIEELTRNTDDLKEQINNLSERFNKIDSFWNIANKLERIENMLLNSKYKGKNMKP